jgi:outer membrane biosynthesis protein TonB
MTEIGRRVGILTVVVSLLFSISLAQAGKTSDAEIAVRKSRIALEQEATKKVEPVFPPIAKAARASGEVKVEVTIDPRLAQQLLSNIKQ